MLEMKSDLQRRSSYNAASREARLDDFNYQKHETMEEKLTHLRDRQSRPKKRLPWFTIISIVSIVPMFFMGDMMPGKPSMGSRATPETQLSQSINESSTNDMATVSVTIGGKTITRQLSVGEIQALQGNM